MADTNGRYMTALEAWSALSAYRADYYAGMAAIYSGDHGDLESTAENETFWARKNHQCRVHVPIGANIASMSAALIFSNAVNATVYHGEDGEKESEQQMRFDQMRQYSELDSMLLEAAETAAALGDAFIKIRWDKNRMDFPRVDSVQPDDAWPEYRNGELCAVHFFVPLQTDVKTQRVTRLYERYTRGLIEYEAYDGDFGTLGAKYSVAELALIGFTPQVFCPVDELLAIHIPNLLPNRAWRNSKHGRADLDGLRDMCDALDETYSSWVRDVRLGKGRVIVPMDYLRRRPDAMESACQTAGYWEFDKDVETYVALDIDVDKAGANAIQITQFDIRADDHMKTCEQFTRGIISRAGYSPQTFGMDTDSAQTSGKALSIREKATAIMRNRKRGYWRDPLQKILTALVHVDAAIYPGRGSHAEDVVKIAFSESMGSDISTVAETVQMLNSAKAASVEQKVNLLYPDWSDADKLAEVERIRKENAFDLPDVIPDYGLGDMETDAGGGNE